MKIHPIKTALLITSGALLSATLHAADDEGAIRFTSAPDIFNWNISNPQPGWEATLDWFFTRLAEEGPDFHLNAGANLVDEASGWFWSETGGN